MDGVAAIPIDSPDPYTTDSFSWSKVLVFHLTTQLSRLRMHGAIPQLQSSWLNA
jgi:hypothetical protein